MIKISNGESTYTLTENAGVWTGQGDGYQFILGDNDPWTLSVEGDDDSGLYSSPVMTGVYTDVFQGQEGEGLFPEWTVIVESLIAIDSQGKEYLLDKEGDTNYLFNDTASGSLLILEHGGLFSDEWFLSMSQFGGLDYELYKSTHLLGAYEMVEERGNVIGGWTVVLSAGSVSIPPPAYRPPSPRDNNPPLRCRVALKTIGKTCRKPSVRTFREAEKINEKQPLKYKL